MDILDRIDSFIKEIEISSEVKYIAEESAIEVIECIIDEVPEDKVILETVVNVIKRDWGLSNKSLLNDFYKIMEYYGILGETENRKTVLEKKGKTIVRKFMNLKSKKRILRLL
jgi:hypothetical protein